MAVDGTVAPATAPTPAAPAPLAPAEREGGRFPLGRVHDVINTPDRPGGRRRVPAV